MQMLAMSYLHNAKTQTGFAFLYWCIHHLAVYEADSGFHINQPC
jgi:hypothetical protein